MTKSRIYRCPKNCTVSDTKGRCPRCGEWLKYDGEHTQEDAMKKTEEIQKNATRTLPNHLY